MLSTQGGFPRRTSQGEAGRVQTHSGYQPLKNNIKGRTKNSDSIVSEGNEWGQRQGKGQGERCGWATGDTTSCPGDNAWKREKIAHPMRSLWDLTGYSRSNEGPLFPDILFPVCPIFPQVNLIQVKRTRSLPQSCLSQIFS